MASILDGGSDPFSAINSDQSGQRSQLAQYAIIQAANYMQKNNYDDAIKAFKKAVAFDPTNTTARDYIGQIYLSQGNNREAISTYKDLVRLQPNSSDAHVKLANAYLQDKQYTQSETEFKTAAKLDPTDPVADYTLGLQYANTDRLPEAEAQFLKVKKISPTDGNVYYALGMVYNKEGRYDDAIPVLQKALSLKKNFADANYELGVAYANTGQTDQANNQLSILSNLDTSMAAELKTAINKPKIVTMENPSNGGFVPILGPNTQLWFLDPSLATPNSTALFTVKINFNTDMDVSSVTNTQNWTISRGNNGQSGFYNDTMPVSSSEVAVPPSPESVAYDPINQQAILTFRLNQNSTGTATIDPSHLVFKFSGQDALGRNMDQTADEIDGFTQTPF